jgi:hypothetical protein
MLEARQVLSTTAAALHSGFLTPGASEVAKAAGVVSSGASQAFSQYTSDLQRVEQSSRVTPAQFENLATDGTELAQAIQSSPLEPAAMTQQLDQLQDTIDTAFVAASYQSSGWTQLQQQLDDSMNGVSLSSLNLVQQTFAQMQVIAREAHVTLANHRKLVADEKAITAALGPKVDTNLGGTGPRDPLVVYYNGQVPNFVHKR